MAFGLLALSMMTAILGSNSILIQPMALAQQATPSSSSAANNQDISNSSTQGNGEEAQLPRVDGFSVRVLATNFSAPHNISSMVPMTPYGSQSAWGRTSHVLTQATGLDSVAWQSPTSGSLKVRMV
jgi:hypothetical protein